MKYLFVFAGLLLFLTTCNSPTSAPLPADLSEFEVEAIPGSNIQKVSKLYEDGTTLEVGQLLNGQKFGAWVTYHPGKPYPQKLISYVDGLANGPYFEFNNRGQMEVKAFYKNNQLHGPWGTYRFGRAEKEANYKDGKLDGFYREYDTANGNIKKEIGYKDGEMHGKYIYFDDDGNVNLEYTYQNGKKVE